MTPDQFTALRTLLEANPEGMTQRELTVAMASDPNTVASLVERMEEAGWVERHPHESDRRAYRIVLLPIARENYAVAREIAVQLQREVLIVLPVEERERFLAQLELVSVACRAAADGTSRNPLKIKNGDAPAKNL